MLSVRRLGAAGVCLLCPALLLGAAPASATELQAEISSVTPGPDRLDVQFRGTDLPAGAVLDRGSVQVLLNGDRVGATAETLKDNTGVAAARRVALVVDTSGSMSGPPLDAARSAALGYLTTVADDVEVGLISFAASPQVLVAPTSDRAQVAEAVRLLEANGGTGLYDAVVLASSTLGTEGQRRILLLSDGEDTESVASLDSAVAAVRDGGLNLDAVALGPNQSAAPALARLATIGGGRLVTATDAVQAATAFQEAARVFSAGLQLKVNVPDGAAGGPASLEVHVKTSTGQLLRADSLVVLPERPVAPEPPSSQGTLVVGLLTLFCGLAAALVLAVRTGDSQAVGRRRTSDVLAAYTLRGQSTKVGDLQPPSRIGSGTVTQGALTFAGRLLDRGERGRRLTTRLDRAAVRFDAREWLVLHIASSMSVLILLLLISNPVLATVGAAFTAAAMHFWLSIKGERRCTAFEAVLPDALQLVASGLSTGYSLPQALTSVVDEGRPPIAEELGRALAEARLGAPLEDALDNVANRMGSGDFRWVVMAIRVQREVGGNLSEVLTTLCQTMRDRGSLRRQIKALSAEGRLGAIILIALPILVAAYLSLINPDFFRPMWETTLGQFLLSGSVTALVVGALWMKRLIKVEA